MCKSQKKWLRCKTSQFGNSSVNKGNQLADKTAKENAGKGIVVLKLKKKLDVLEQKPNYSYQNRQLATLLEAMENSLCLFALLYIYNFNSNSI